MALYRKYRPASFAEVVGQQHVTEPLSIALDSGRINHAYLFSGPRGCGKTSSARILARSLNCVQGPTSTPCGVCDSCVSLAPGGPGNLDVTELDAATHNGVDEMRELRERAFYAPAESRYRVFIIDEAHMISTAGFNALLKIVEEPPEHLIFIFATTEPEKLLQTIRSRTHNYPFRLLTPPDMTGLLTRIVGEEGVPVEDSVYPLVVRAGGGSPRDSLSIMDQLLAGANEEGVTYQRALGLLGVTDSALLDAAVESLANQDQAGLFAVVDEVIDAGYDPRRFAEDLLDRFRDLLVLQAVPEAFSRGLVNAPADEQERLQNQAHMLGQATLTRCAALVNEGLDQMRGATAPRLLLEILCARMALPAAGMTVEALAQRVEALEQGGVQLPGVGRANATGSNAAGAAASAPTAAGLSSGRSYTRPSRRQAAPATAQTGADNADGAAEKTNTATPVTPQANAASQSLPSTSAEHVTPDAKASEPASSEPGAPVAEPQPAPDSAAPAPADSEPSAAPEEARVQDTAVPEEPEAIAEARRAREIMDRNRGRTSPNTRPDEGHAARAAQPHATESHTPEDHAPEEDTTEGHSPESSEAAEFASRWDELLSVVKETELSAWIALRDATPRSTGPDASDTQPGSAEADKQSGGAFDEGTFYVDHRTGALAKFVNSDKNQAIYRQATQKVFGTAKGITALVGGNSPGKADTAASEQPELTLPTEPAPPAARPGGADQPNAEAPQAHNPVPAEQDLGNSAVRSAASSALARARAMDEAMRQRRPNTTTPTEPTPAKNETPKEATGWQARVARIRAKQEYNLANGFNGVPLPDEPPEDPWESGPPNNGAFPGPTTQGPTTQGPNSTNPNAGAPGGFNNPSNTGNPNPAGGQGPRTAAGGVGLTEGNNGAPAPAAPEETEEERRIRQQNELLEDMARGPGEIDHRTPLEIAGELIESQLGGKRIR